MAGRSLLPESVERYVREWYRHEPPLWQRLRTETAALPQARMQVGPDQSALLALLARTIEARRALEIGTFTGLSALAVASALPTDGRLIACDVSVEWTDVARRYWAEAELADRIELRLGPALQTLAELRRTVGAGSFDFAFIDADKESYDAYYEACLVLVRQGGLIVVDNALWSGTVADPTINDPDTAAIRALNQKVRDDTRVEACLLTVGDGMLLVRNRSAG